MSPYAASVCALTDWRWALADTSPGAPQDELLQLFGLDEDGQIALQCAFDVEDIDAAIAELDAALLRDSRSAQPQPRRLDNAASRVLERYLAHFPARDWDAMAEMLTRRHLRPTIAVTW